MGRRGSAAEGDHFRRSAGARRTILPYRNDVSIIFHAEAAAEHPRGVAKSLNWRSARSATDLPPRMLCEILRVERALLRPAPIIQACGNCSREDVDARGQ